MSIGFKLHGLRDYDAPFIGRFEYKCKSVGQCIFRAAFKPKYLEGKENVMKLENTQHQNIRISQIQK